MQCSLTLIIHRPLGLPRAGRPNNNYNNYNYNYNYNNEYMRSVIITIITTIKLLAVIIVTFYSGLFFDTFSHPFIKQTVFFNPYKAH